MKISLLWSAPRFAAAFHCSWIPSSNSPGFPGNHSLRFNRGSLVSGVGIRKASTSVQHESLAIWTIDTQTDKKYEFIIDRQPSSHSRGTRFSNFMNFFPSAEVIESISSVVSKNVHPGLVPSNMDRFWNSLLWLSETTPMFPQPQDLLNSACKVQRDNDLMIAATTATQTLYPWSLTSMNKKDLITQAENKGVDIKRDFRDLSKWTFLPQKKYPGPYLRIHELPYFICSPFILT